MIDEYVEEMRYHAALAYAYEQAAKQLLEGFDEVRSCDRHATLRAVEFFERRHKHHQSLVGWNNLSLSNRDGDAV